MSEPDQQSGGIVAAPAAASSTAALSHPQRRNVAQTISSAILSILIHAGILAAMAMVTWVIVRNPEPPIVLHFGGGGGGAGGSGDAGSRAGGRGRGTSTIQRTSTLANQAAMQLAPAPAPTRTPGSIAAPAPDVGEPAAGGDGSDLALAAFAGAGSGGGSGGGQGTGMGPGIGSGSGLGGMLDNMRHRGLDVVFVLDATDSMSPYIGQGKARLRQIVNVVSNLVGVGQPGSHANGVRFGLVTFKDYGDDYGIGATRSFPLTSDTDKLQKAIDQITAGGGGDIPEPLDAALKAAIDRRMGWQRARMSEIVLVTDAPCHSLSRHIAFKEAAYFAKSMGGQINVIDVGGVADGKRVRETVLPDLQQIAQAGNGSAFLLQNDKAFWRHLIISIFGHRYEQDIQQIIDKYVKPEK